MPTFRTVLHQQGNNVGIVVPDAVVAELGAGKRPLVKVTIDGAYSFVYTIAVMGGRNMIGFSAAHRAASGFQGGDEVEVALELETAPREVDMPPELPRPSPRIRSPPRHSRSCRSRSAKSTRARSARRRPTRPGSAGSTRSWRGCAASSRRRLPPGPGPVRSRRVGVERHGVLPPGRDDRRDDPPALSATSPRTERVGSPSQQFGEHLAVRAQLAGRELARSGCPTRGRTGRRARWSPGRGRARPG